METKGSEFHVKLGGIKFSSEVEKRIEVGIQALILNELAGFKPNPEDPDGDGDGTGHLGPDPIMLVKPKRWRGMVCLKTQGPLLDNALKEINPLINGIEGR